MEPGAKRWRYTVLGLNARSGGRDEFYIDSLYQVHVRNEHSAAGFYRRATEADLLALRLDGRIRLC